MKQAKGILFDLDGTLLDTARDLGNSLNFLLRKHQLVEKRYQEYRPLASHGARGLLELGFGTDNGYDMGQLRAEFLDHYQHNLCVDTIAFEGIGPMLDGIRKRHLPWGIVTNKPEFLTHPLLVHFSQFSDCQTLVCGDTLDQAKPYPAPMLLAAEQLNIEPEAIWYVGDAERDIQAAKNAGMPSILAEYGYISSADDPKSWNADLTLTSPQDLIDHLSTSGSS